MTDLDTAEELTARALDVARAAGDVDLELVALAQLGHDPGRPGRDRRGFALIDEAMAAALAGERSTLDTVVYTCCDMLNACELADDIERAAQWCQVADEFVAHVRLPVPVRRVPHLLRQRAHRQGPVGRRRAGAGHRAADHRRAPAPGLHAKALVRLAALRIRQGRLEDADQLLAQLSEGVEAEAEAALSVAALLLARGDAPAAARQPRVHGCAELRAASVAAGRRLSTCSSTLSWPRGTWTGACDGGPARRPGDCHADSDRLRCAGRRPPRVAWRWPAVTEERRRAAGGGPPGRGPGSTCRSRRPALAREIARLVADSQPEVAVDHARACSGDLREARR